MDIGYYADGGILNHEGITTSMPITMRSIIGSIGNFMGHIIHENTGNISKRNYHSQMWDILWSVEIG